MTEKEITERLEKLDNEILVLLKQGLQQCTGDLKYQLVDIICNILSRRQKNGICKKT